MVFLIKLFSRLPLFLLYLLADFMYLFLRLVRYRKKVILTNLHNSFPEKSDAEITSILKQFYWNFANFMVEILKGFTISQKEINGRVSFTNLDILDEFVQKQQSVVFLVAHQFNWEWALQSGSMQLPMQLDGIYQRLSNSKSNKLILDSRSRFGATLIERETSLKQLVSRRKLFRGIAIISDQVPNRDIKTPVFWADFFHQETAFNMGAERIAKMLKMPTLFMNIQSPKRGYYNVEFVKLTEPPYSQSEGDILKAYIASTELLIRENPANWLWSHKRWKYTKEEWQQTIDKQKKALKSNQN